MPHPGLFFVAALAALPLTAQQPAACNCADDPPILVTGELVYLPLPAGIKVEGADHPDDFAVQAAGRRMNAIVPGLPAGKYTVEVDVAETVCRGRGERVMDILVGRTVLAQDVDLIKRGGGFAQACQLAGTVDYEPWVVDQDFVIHFIGRTNDAVFNAIRVMDADGKVVASLTAAELQAQEPADAGRIPVVATPPIYRDPAKPRAERIDDLIARMSLREKVAQMLNAAPAIERLGVPAYNYWSEALHGVARAGTATSFPQAIGMAAMWDAPLLHEVADAIATEARAKYADAIAHGVYAQNYGLTFWSPNINLFRDPRWGRGQETYGEDPFLTSRLAVAFITG
ncbi:MAG TPA: glycoside hydrolase family 3 N-terminal domain-containing protein, partial [Opitutaceae bacterium]|nr:glycoside hydrolase family 3 N-terminal domain-containing protein [Opitutaceae bacterium]